MTDVPTRSTTDVEVRYAETDQMGVVHHSRYLVWFELARTQLCREAGHPYDEIEKQGLWLMVSGAHLSYRDGARYGDRVQVECRVSRAASRALHFDYRVLRGEQLLVSGRTEHIWVDAETKTTTRAPAELLALFREMAAAERD
ncbi:MAG: thioesterase family protein [Acidobacteriota bacterium]